MRRTWWSTTSSGHDSWYTRWVLLESSWCSNECSMLIYDPGSPRATFLEVEEEEEAKRQGNLQCHLLPTLPSLLDTTLLDPVLCLLINRLSRSLGLCLSLGNAESTSPAESLTPSPKCRPVFWSILNSMYCCAARDKGIGAGCVGISAPF